MQSTRPAAHKTFLRVKHRHHNVFVDGVLPAPYRDPGSRSCPSVQPWCFNAVIVGTARYNCSGMDAILPTGCACSVVVTLAIMPERGIASFDLRATLISPDVKSRFSYRCGVEELLRHTYPLYLFSSLRSVLTSCNQNCHLLQRYSGLLFS